MAWQPKSFKAVEDTGWKPKSFKAETPAASEVDDSGLRSSFAQNAADSASFGFKDELQGGLGALLDLLSAKSPDAPGGAENFGENYRGLRDISRDELGQVSEADPTGAIAGQLAGLVVPGAAGGKMLKGAGQLGMKGAAAIGAGAGAAEGVGSSESEDVLGLLRDAGVGAGAGVAGAGVGAGIGKGIGKLADKYSDRMGKKVLDRNKDLVGEMVDAAKGAARTEKAASGSAAVRSAEATLKDRMEDAAAIPRMFENQKRAGDDDLLKLLRMKNSRKGVVPPVRASDVEGTIAQARRALREAKKAGIELTPEEERLIIQMATPMAEETIGKQTAGSMTKNILSSMKGGASETLSDLSAGQWGKLGGNAIAGLGAGAVFGPIAGISTALGAGALKNVNMKRVQDVLNLMQGKAARGVGRAAQIGPTKAAALGMYGADATVQTEEESTDAFLKQQTDKGARKRMRGL